MKLTAAVACAVVLVALAGCAPAPTPVPGTEPPPARTPAADVAGIENLPTTGIPDYQLGGAYDPAPGVTIVARDSTEQPAAGLYSICYVNGFQSQPQDAALWLEGHPDLVLQNADGEPVFDENWPDEMLLDTSTAAGRTGIAEVIGESISGCSAAGFQAVEFDNLDSFTRSDDALTEENNVALAVLLVSIAHEHGLAAGQKNTAGLGERGRDEIGFDFAIAEECHRWSECSAYTSVYGDRVIDIEYTDDLLGTVDAVCSDPHTPPLTIIRDRDLAMPGSEGYAFTPCAGV